MPCMIEPIQSVVFKSTIIVFFFLFVRLNLYRVLYLNTTTTNADGSQTLLNLYRVLYLNWAETLNGIFTKD